MGPRLKVGGRQVARLGLAEELPEHGKLPLAYGKIPRGQTAHFNELQDILRAFVVHLLHAHVVRPGDPLLLLGGLFFLLRLSLLAYLRPRHGQNGVRKLVKGKGYGRMVNDPDLSVHRVGLVIHAAGKAQDAGGVQGRGVRSKPLKCFAEEFLHDVPARQGRRRDDLLIDPLEVQTVT